jgi:P27 family predicted phage terminase small subunit
MKAGTPDKPSNLSKYASAEWDRLMSEIEASGIQLSKAHRALVSEAAKIAADMADAWEVIETEGAYILNEKTGQSQAHPAVKRLDGLRQQKVKVLSLIGLRSPVAGESGEKSLDDLLDD